MRSRVERSIGAAERGAVQPRTRRRPVPGADADGGNQVRRRIVEQVPLRSQRVQRMTEQQRDEARVLLAVGWQGKAKAGAQDATLTLTSTGTHSCAARAESTDGQTLESEFDNEATHAEMGIVGRTEAIRSLQIEKEPCPRCAVVLNALGLSDRVTYKKSGQKDNPTWRFPATWEQAKISGLLGIDAYAASDAAPRGTKRSPGVTDADHQVLSTYFRTNKWW